MPDFHNPTGITMSLERRRHLLQLAEDFDFVILEDDPYRRIRFESEAVPSIKSMDEAGRVIAIGTVSKVLAPDCGSAGPSARPRSSGAWGCRNPTVAPAPSPSGW